MNRIVKQLLILVLIFLVIYWVQTIDDKNKNKKRDSLYDKIKFPLLVCAIIGLLLNLNLGGIINCKEESEIIIIQPNYQPNYGKSYGIKNPDVYLDMNY